MIQRSLLTRLYAVYTVLVLLLALLTSALVIPTLRRASEADVRRSLEAQTTLLAHLAQPAFRQLQESATTDLEAIIALASVQQLTQQVEDASSSTHTRFTLVTLDGTVIADTHESPEALGNHAQRPELRAAQTEGKGLSVRYSRTLGVNMMYVALPIVDDGQIIGLARSAVSLDSIDRRIDDLRARVALSALTALLVALIVGWWLGRRITTPLRQVTAAVRAMQHGTTSERIQVESQDEVGTLARTFNEMADELEARLEELDHDRSQTLAILSSMSDGVIAVDESERIVQLNAAAGHMLDIDVKNSVGRPVWEVVRVTDVCALIAKVIRGVQVDSAETTTTATVGERYLKLDAAALTNDENDAVGAVVVLHDLTRLRRLEAVRKDFVSNVSHELKTPLTAIAGFLDSMLNDTSMDPEVRQRFLEKSRKQTGRLDELVRDLLHLSKVEREDEHRDDVAIDLRAPIERAAESLASIFDRKQVDLEVDLAPQELRVRADDESVRQIFDNLLTNAVRYTEAGGRVTIRAYRHRSHARIEVQDTGIGIESRHHERIFERFYRVDTARSRELGGTGLGLAIVKHVIQNLDGSIQLESSPGEGSTFRVDLPLADSPANANSTNLRQPPLNP